MSYIEREALLKNAQTYSMEFGEYLGEDVRDVDAILADRVKKAPAADVAPVVHGEWVLVGTNEHDYETSVEEKCSLCGRYVYRYDTEPQDNFCPNCGAKIGGEKHE